MATTKWSQAPTLLQVGHYLTYPQIHHSDNPVVENMYSNMPVLSLEPYTLSDDVNNAGPPGIWWETQSYLPGHTEASLTYLSHETFGCVDIGCQVSCQENLIQHSNFLFVGSVAQSWEGGRKPGCWNCLLNGKPESCKDS